MLITLLFSKFTDDPPAVFALAALLRSALEYLTSYITEKAFHPRRRDDSAKKFSLSHIKREAQKRHISFFTAATCQRSSPDRGGVMRRRPKKAISVNPVSSSHFRSSLRV